MPKKDETASDVADAEQSIDSVYDYLYYDARRVGSFLAQFDPSGHIQQITQREMFSKGGKRGYNLKLGGSIPVPGSPEAAEGSVSFGRDPEKGGSEEMALVYDPLWMNAKLFLDYLDERRLVKRDLATAKMGQFVLASGAISVFDLATIAKIWKTTSIQTISENAGTKGGGKSKGPSEVNPAKFGMEIVALLPHAAQFYMESAQRTIWGTFREEGMVVPPSDLLLKHGALIAGSWSLLGILDAKPDDGATMEPGGDLGLKIVTEGMTSILGVLGPMARHLLGRPNKAFGVTPLMIFRDAGG